MNLLNTLTMSANALLPEARKNNDQWGTATYKGIEFDINVWGGEHTDDGAFKATAYLVFDDSIDTSVGIPLYLDDNKANV